MIDLSPPFVPPLSDAWIEARRRHLIAEVTTRSRGRLTRRRMAVGMGALIASSAAVVFGVVGIGEQAAFAGWTSTPTPAAAGQTATATAACQARLRAAGSSAADSPVSLVDTRGPFTLLVFGDSASTALCVSGATFTSITPSEPPAVPAVSSGNVVVGHASYTSRNGQPYTLIEGQVGSSVTGVGLVLGDGSHVTATVNGGRFAAWWPGVDGIASAQVTTAQGTTTQPLDIATPTSPPQVHNSGQGS